MATALNAQRFRTDSPTSGADDDIHDLHELLTVKEAAHFLKVPVSWIYEHVRPDAVDRLPSVKLGKYLRFDDRDLRAYVDAKRAEAVRVSARRG